MSEPAETRPDYDNDSDNDYDFLGRVKWSDFKRHWM
jgi:hypothetical protein